MRTQARLPAALGALHNFIRNNNPDDVADFEDDNENLYDGGQPFMGELVDGVPNRVERAWASQRQEHCEGYVGTVSARESCKRAVRFASPPHDISQAMGSCTIVLRLHLLVLSY